MDRELPYHRTLEDYASLSRCNVRSAEVRHATNEFKEWMNHNVLSLTTLPPLFPFLMKTAEDVCDCNLCLLKGKYQEAMRQLHQEIEAKKAIDNDNDNNILPDQEATIEGATVRDLDDMDPVEQAKIIYGDFLTGEGEQMADVYLPFFASFLSTDQETIRRHKRIQQYEESIKSSQQQSRQHERNMANMKIETRANRSSSTLHEIYTMISTRESSYIYWESKLWGYTRLGRNTAKLYRVPAIVLDDRFDPLVLSYEEDAYALKFKKLDPTLVMASSAKQELRDFYESFSEKLKTVTLIEGTDPDFLTKIHRTQRAILVCSKRSDWPAGEIDVPFATVENKKKGYYALLFAMIYRIASMQTSNGIIPCDAVNTLLTSERTIDAENEQQAHSLDNAVHRSIDRLGEILRASHDVEIELKPLRAKRMDLQRLHDEGAHEVFGHLAKHIKHYFDLGGIGCDYRCRGMVLSLVSVEIVEMELSNMGTKYVNIDLRRTTPYFLFDRETTQNLLRGRGMKVPEFKFDPEMPYCGFEMIDAMLRIPTAEVVPHPSVILHYKRTDAAPECQVGKLLGFGYSCFVHQIDNSTFIKIPWRPNHIPTLQKELDTLLVLQRTSSCPFIPSSLTCELAFVTFRRGCDKSQHPALAMSGVVGLEASSCPPFSTAQLQQIFKDIQSALVHAHGAGVCHLDVRPSKITVKDDADGSIQVQLGHWGCSRRMTGDLPNGFVGCKPFAHDDIHDKTEADIWQPRPMHDFASLAFTMVSLIVDRPDEALWRDFYYNEVNDQMLERRKALSRKVINESELEQRIKEELLRYLLVKEADYPFQPQEAQATVAATTAVVDLLQQYDAFGTGTLQATLLEPEDSKRETAKIQDKEQPLPQRQQEEVKAGKRKLDEAT